MSKDNTQTVVTERVHEIDISGGTTREEVLDRDKIRTRASKRYKDNYDLIDWGSKPTEKKPDAA